MIFAELEYSEHYDAIHASLVEYIQSRFDNVQSGHQGDSWIWIFSGEDKVAIDTFSSMKHQVKSDKANTKLLNAVLSLLSQCYTLNVFSQPELEGDEDFD
jgi:hypothetical protein